MHLGIGPIDDLLNKAPPGQPLLLHAEPGVDADPVLRQMSQLADEAGHRIVYLNTDRSPDAVLTALGLSRDKVTFLDAYSPTIGRRDDAATPLTDLSNVDDVLGAIERAAHEHPKALFILDSLSSWALRADPGRIVARRRRLFKAVSAYEEALVWFAEWNDPHAAQLLAPFRTRVDLLTVKARILTNQYIRVDRIDGEEVQKPAALMYRPGPHGMQVYIPKVVVTGPPDAGKTSLIRSVSDHFAGSDRHGTTVALDKGVLEMPGLRAEIFGTPGQQRFQPVIDTVLRQALGVLVLVDATRPESFPRVEQVLREVRMKGRAVALLVTHVDQHGAEDPMGVGEKVHAASDVRIYSCNATDPEEARPVVESFLQGLLVGRGAEVTA